MIHIILSYRFFAFFVKSFASFAVNKKSFIIIILFVIADFNPVSVFCQEAQLPEMIRDIAEELASSDAGEEEAEAYLDRLYDLADNPVNINSGDESEISRLFFLSDFQVKALADYTITSGKILSFYELAYIPGLDRTTAEMLIPFSTLESKHDYIKDPMRIRHSFQTNMSLKRGREDSSFQGSAWKILTKYKFTAGSFSGGFTIEKDAGEKLFPGGAAYPDFLSAGLAWTGKGIVRKVIFGDYSVKFGQGININTGLRTGLTLTSQSYMSSTNEVKQYTSTDENNFFRGLAVMLSYRKTDLSIFCSKNNIDSTLATPGTDTKEYIKSLYTSGTHNTASLLMKKDAVSESSIGMNLTFNFRKFRFGCVYSEDRFSLPFQPDGSDPSKIHAFSGNRNITGSVYYNSMTRMILLYGELSANDVQRYALLQGLSVRPSDRLSLNLIYWEYRPGFTLFHGKGPGGISGTYPERSMMGNFTFEAARHLFLSGGYVFQSYPWLKYRCSSPSCGIRREVRMKYDPSERLVFDCLYSYRLTCADMPGSSGIPELKQMISRSLKAAVKYSAGEYVIIGTRIDLKSFEPSGSRGFLLLQDFNWKIRKIPATIWLRYCIFRTDDFDSRIYTWENDLVYTFSIPSMYGTGSRFYLMAAYKFARKAEIRVKYGVLTGYGGYPIGTDEIKVQIRIVI
jgi:hypothetical protein